MSDEAKTVEDCTLCGGTGELADISASESANVIYGCPACMEADHETALAAARIEGAEAMLDAVAKHQCEGCREGWPIEIAECDDEPMHVIPIEKRKRWEQGLGDTHIDCECPDLDPRDVVEKLDAK